ncbi:MAG: hypothetical protein K6C08_02000 [Oscillospiraceae bacterium]|nr:hypothetical protein [Oscillospiraceae bacterium]
MAQDYRDILNETVGRLWSQAKDLAETSGVKEIYEKGADRAKSFGNATKLTVELNRDHTELQRIYAEIGKLYVDQTSEPSGFFLPLFQQLEEQKRLIASKEAEIENYKASFEQHTETPDAEIMDFESIVNQTEDDGRQ